MTWGPGGPPVDERVPKIGWLGLGEVVGVTGDLPCSAAMMAKTAEQIAAMTPACCRIEARTRVSVSGSATFVAL